jgi:nucleotide-binding universal stress UspA family protein
MDLLDSAHGPWSALPRTTWRRTPVNTSTRKIVVGVDGTRDGERAIKYGVAMASRDDLDLRLVHVPADIEFYAPMMPYVDMGAVHEIGGAVLREAAKQAQELDLKRTDVVPGVNDQPKAQETKEKRLDVVV